MGGLSVIAPRTMSRRAARARTPKVVRTVKGLLFKDDFTDLSNWTAGAGWAADTTRPIYLAYPTFVTLKAPGTIGVDLDASGIREAHVLVRPDGPDGRKGRWYLFHNGADGQEATTDPSVWRVRYRYSDDRGKTWSALATLQDLLTGSPHNYPCMGGFMFLHSDGQYYFTVNDAHNVNAFGEPIEPYPSTVYKAPWCAGPFSFIRASPALGAGGAFDDTNDCISWIEQTADGTWHVYYSAKKSGAWTVGHATASTPDGPYTKDGSGNFVATAITGSGKAQLENPKKWWSRILSKHILFANDVDVGGGYTYANQIAYSDTETDFRGADVYRNTTQYDIWPWDCRTGAALTVPSPLVTERGKVVVDPLSGFVPITFSAEAPTTFNGFNNLSRYGNTLGMTLRQGVLEPCAGAAKFTPGGTALVARAITHDDFVAEFAFEFDASATGAGEGLGFAYRRSVTTASDTFNGYLIWIVNNADVFLYKNTGGSYSQIGSANPTGLGKSADSRQLFNIRVKVVVVGNNHKVYFNGNSSPAMNVTDATYASGSSVAFRASVPCWLRHLHMRTSDTITVRGCPPSKAVDLRVYGGPVMESQTASGVGVATFTPYHSPGHELEVDGHPCPVPDGVYGGDTYEYLA